LSVGFSWSHGGRERRVERLSEIEVKNTGWHIVNCPLLCYAFGKHTIRRAIVMFCADTGAFEAIDTSKMTRVAMSVDEAKDIGEAIDVVRKYGHGTGEVCLPLVNGFIEAVLPTLKKYRKKLTKK